MTAWRVFTETNEFKSAARPWWSVGLGVELRCYVDGELRGMTEVTQKAALSSGGVQVCIIYAALGADSPGHIHSIEVVRLDVTIASRHVSDATRCSDRLVAR